MSVIRDNVIVAPGVDTVTEAELNTTTIEPGIYTLAANKTINGQASSRWTVICLANNSGSTPVCYSQIWIPSQNNVAQKASRIYVRVINSAGTGYNGFATMVNDSDAVNNKTSYPTEIYIQSTQPTAVAGKNIIWIDTSS